MHSVIVFKKDTCNFIFQFKELIEVKNNYMHTWKKERKKEKVQNLTFVFADHLFINKKFYLK